MPKMTFTVDEKTKEQLGVLREKMEAPSDVEVFRRLLKLGLYFFEKTQEEGCTLKLERDDRVWEVTLLF